MTTRDNEKGERQIREDGPAESKGDFLKKVDKTMRKRESEHGRKPDSPLSPDSTR